MSLVLSPSPVYVQVADFIRMQNWSFESPSGNQFIYRKDNLFLPELRSFTLKVKDVYINSILRGYTDLKLKTTVQYESGLNNWVIIPTSIQERPITSASITESFFMSPVVGSNTEAGDHVATLKFQITGQRFGLEIVISEFESTLLLKVFEAGHFFNPVTLSVIREPLTSIGANFTVSGNNWRVTTPPGIAIMHGSALLLPSGESELTGSGTTEIGITIGDIEENTTSLETIFPIRISYLTREYTLPLTVISIDDYAPKRIEFNISSGLLDQASQSIFFKEPGNYTVNKPSWLMATKKEGETRSLELTMISPDSFGTGVYNSWISLVFSNRTIIVPVVLNSFDGFNLGIKANEIIFSESMPLLTFSTNNQNTHLELEIFLDDENRNIFNFIYKIPFFNRFANFSLAEVTNRMLSFLRVEEKDYTKMSLPKFGLIVREKSEENILREFKKTGMSIMPGLRPALFNETGILQSEVVLSRFTKRGVAVVNVISESRNFSYFIRKNNETIATYTNVSGALRSLYISFFELGAEEGDIIEVVVIAGNTTLEKAFTIIPMTNNSTVIYYVNSFGLTSSIEFTGELKIEKETKKKFEKYKENGIEKNRAFTVSSEERLKINTGFLLASQTREVAELIKSNKAWFYQNGKRFYMVPSSEKQTILDTEDFTKDHEIEYLINDTDYAQDYF